MRKSNLYIKCLNAAQKIKDNGLVLGDMDLEAIVDLLYKIETEKLEKDAISDQAIEFNDEIVSIEPIGMVETCDISVTGDNLFYCNGILTKNSFGLPATSDFFFALITTEDLEKTGQLMVKQLKNRWGSIDHPKRFIIGVDRAKMKLYDVEESAQANVSGGPKQSDQPVFDQSGMMQDSDFDPTMLTSRKKKPKFNNFS